MLGVNLSSLTLSGEQAELARYGEHVARGAAAITGTEASAFASFALDDGGVLVVEQLRGGGRWFIAPDRSFLFVASFLGSEEALEAYRDGRRTALTWPLPASDCAP